MVDFYASLSRLFFATRLWIHVSWSGSGSGQMKWIRNTYYLLNMFWTVGHLFLLLSLLFKMQINYLWWCDWLVIRIPFTFPLDLFVSKLNTWKLCNKKDSWVAFSSRRRFLYFWCCRQDFLPRFLCYHLADLFDWNILTNEWTPVLWWNRDGACTIYTVHCTVQLLWNKRFPLNRAALRRPVII